MQPSEETERVRRIWERLAPRYDEKVRLPERLLFAGGREWVCALALCSIPDPRAAVREMKRVLRPGGRVLLLEHVRSPRFMVRTLQRALEPIAVWLEGDHLVREPVELLRAEGCEIDEVERSKLGVVERIAARKPEPGTSGRDGPPR